MNATLRARRSSLAMISVALWSRQSFNASASFGRSLRLPLSTSVTSATSRQYSGTLMANGVDDILVKNTTDNHMYVWWVNSTTDTLTGIDLGTYWGNITYVAGGSFLGNGVEDMLVKNNVARGLKKRPCLGPCYSEQWIWKVTVRWASIGNASAAAKSIPHPIIAIANGS